ncbi:YwpF family protein [Ornithinibacillus xuwenensis]|uniref:YwpF family protein n=1 Tax=Ornithinibacillus xuwenensis TaxID=3144668 RepID=A0ABU9XEC0_9BACI
MKTFKLKSLQVIESENEEISKKDTTLVDGLIINREDDKSNWLIEAFLEVDYLDYFNELRQRQEQVLVEVRISKDTNDPATFITTIDSLNNINDYISVILIGTIVDKRKSKIEEMLGELIEQGYQGEELLERFKKQL